LGLKVDLSSFQLLPFQFKMKKRCLPTLTFEVLDRRAQFLQKLLEAIANTMQIRAKPNRLENCIRSLLDLSVVHPTEP
jgi:hypothetical protein